MNENKPTFSLAQLRALAVGEARILSPNPEPGAYPDGDDAYLEYSWVEWVAAGCPPISQIM